MFLTLLGSLIFCWLKICFCDDIVGRFVFNKSGLVLDFWARRFAFKFSPGNYSDWASPKTPLAKVHPRAGVCFSILS